MDIEYIGNLDISINKHKYQTLGLSQLEHHERIKSYSTKAFLKVMNYLFTYAFKWYSLRQVK